MRVQVARWVVRPAMAATTTELATLPFFNWQPPRQRLRGGGRLSTKKRRRWLCLQRRQARRCRGSGEPRSLIRERPAKRKLVRRRRFDSHLVVGPRRRRNQVRRRRFDSHLVVEPRRRRLHPDHPWYVKNWKNCLRLVRSLLLHLRVLARQRRQGHWRRAARWQPLLPWEAAEQNCAHLQDELVLSK